MKTINLKREDLGSLIQIDRFEYATIVLVNLELVVDAFKMDVLGMQRLICKLQTQKEASSEKAVCLTFKGHKVFEITQETYNAVLQMKKLKGNYFEENAKSDLINLWELAEQFYTNAHEPYRITLANID